MTPQEYTQKLELLQREFETAKKEISKRFVLTNNTVKIGDVIKDNTTAIKVEKIQIAMPFTRDELPSAVYTGIIVNKDGKPNKKGQKASVWQRNLVK
jgi:hypothetical protein